MLTDFPLKYPTSEENEKLLIPLDFFFLPFASSVWLIEGT